MDYETKKWLIAIFLFTLALRLILTFTHANLTYDSYFHLRQVESITERGFPLYSDDLSYGGRDLRFLPFFHYFMAVFALFLPLEVVARLMPNVLLALLTVIIYWIAYKMTNHKVSSLLSALTVGLLPILYSTNNFSTEALFLPLVFIAVYAFLNLEQKKFLYLYLLSFLLLSLTSSVTLLLLVGFVVYILLSYMENKKFSRSELEVMFFSLVFFIWVQLLFFKDLLATQGVRFIWQNIPQQIILDYFPSFSIFEVIIVISVIPFLTGIFVVYNSLFKEKNNPAFLLISLVISAGLLAWLKLIPLKISLAFFGITLAILFSLFYEDLLQYLSQSKFSQWLPNLAVVTGALLFLSMIFPALNVASTQDIPSTEDLQAFRWMETNLPAQARVAAVLEEGHLITYYGRRMNVMDDNFNLIEEVEERFVDLNSIFTTSLQTHAVSLFDKYGITHLVFSNKARSKTGNSNFQFLTVDCYERIYKEGVKIYAVKCSLAK